MTDLTPIDHEDSVARVRPDSLSAILEDLLSALGDMGALSIGVLAQILQERGTGVLMVLFALFLALPSGVLPGLNTLFALPLIILAGQLVAGRHTAILPGAVMRRRLDPAHVRGVVSRLLPFLRKLETIIRPRAGFVIEGAGLRVSSALALLLALFAAIPVPLTHTVPGFALLLFSIAFTMGDGLLAAFGLLLGLGYVAAIVALFAIFGVELVSHLHALLHHTAATSGTPV